MIGWGWFIKKKNNNNNASRDPCTKVSMSAYFKNRVFKPWGVFGFVFLGYFNNNNMTTEYDYFKQREDVFRMRIIDSRGEIWVAFLLFKFLFHFWKSKLEYRYI